VSFLTHLVSDIEHLHGYSRTVERTVGISGHKGRKGISVDRTHRRQAQRPIQLECSREPGFRRQMTIAHFQHPARSAASSAVNFDGVAGMEKRESVFLSLADAIARSGPAIRMPTATAIM